MVPPPHWKLIIGVGNPLPQYKQTYHNAGFLFLDFLMQDRTELPAACRLLKSDVFMNESGSFVAKQIRKNKIRPENLLLVHDDSDLLLGNYKLSFGRGAGGHKGVGDIIKALKTEGFWRLRIGIRPPAEKTRHKAGAFVLKKIAPAGQKILAAVFAEIAAQLIRQIGRQSQSEKN